MSALSAASLVFATAIAALGLSLAVAAHGSPALREARTVAQVVKSRGVARITVARLP